MIFGRWLFLGMGVFSALIAGLSNLAPQLVENIYSRIWSPFVTSILTYLTRWIPFSVGEVLLGAGLIWALVSLINWVAAFFRQGAIFMSIMGDGLLTVGAVLGIILFTFVAIWGLNYVRPPLMQTLGWSKQSITPDLLEQLSLKSIEQATLARSQLPVSQDEVVTSYLTWEDIKNLSRDLYQNLPPSLSFLQRGFSPPKPLISSQLFSYLGISGIYLPWTGEANVNTDSPFFRLPGIIAHEMAHQRGIAREDEANYLGYIACRSSEKPLFRYSGALLAFSYLISALREADETRFKSVWKAVPLGIKKDFEAERAHYEGKKGPIRDIAQGANDLYLKANGQSGIASYSQVVELIVAESETKPGW